jgi:hypothetical protein
MRGSFQLSWNNPIARLPILLRSQNKPQHVISGTQIGIVIVRATPARKLINGCLVV